MIYRVVIIDNKGNEVILSEKDGKWLMEGNPSVDMELVMQGALEKLKEAEKGV